MFSVVLRNYRFEIIDFTNNIQLPFFMIIKNELKSMNFLFLVSLIREDMLTNSTRRSKIMIFLPFPSW